MMATTIGATHTAIAGERALCVATVVARDVTRLRALSARKRAVRVAREIARICGCTRAAAGAIVAGQVAV